VIVRYSVATKEIFGMMNRLCPLANRS
jgi:hypothetical protein